VIEAARAWAERLRRDHPEVLRVGYFGSYARDDYVPGSDMDVLLELAGSGKARWQDRAEDYHPDGFPVPVDIFAYTQKEIETMRRDGTAFLQTILNEIVWLP